MSQTSTISSNGHHKPARDAHRFPSDRRLSNRGAGTPEELIDRQLETALGQLAEARDNLKAARRRVVQLEDAITNWEHFAAALRRNAGGGRAASA